MEINVSFSNEEVKAFLQKEALRLVQRAEVMVIDRISIDAYWNSNVRMHEWTKEDENQQKELSLPGVNVDQAVYGIAPFESTE